MSNTQARTSSNRGIFAGMAVAAVFGFAFSSGALDNVYVPPIDASIAHCAVAEHSTSNHMDPHHGLHYYGYDY